jgi:hypothetical protein
MSATVQLNAQLDPDVASIRPFLIHHAHHLSLHQGPRPTALMRCDVCVDGWSKELIYVACGRRRRDGVWMLGRVDGSVPDGGLHNGTVHLACQTT